jgi:hypothetical protein
MIYKNRVWKYYHGALLPQSAPHIKIELKKEEEQKLLKLSKAYFLRYVSNWDKEEESQFWYVIKDNFGGLEELSANSRSKVRRGLNHCIVKKVTQEVIANEGYKVYKHALKNYNTYIEPADKKTFIKTILASRMCDFWAVYKKDEDRMIAYSQNAIEENSVNYSTIKFHPEYLKLYPSYALFFTMNQYYLEEKNFLYVNDGAKSISHNTNIQTFLIDKFKFRKAYCKLHIVYRWDIGLAVKVLYLFKSFMPQINSKIFNKVSVLLKQEEIRRSFEK